MNFILWSKYIFNWNDNMIFIIENQLIDFISFIYLVDHDHTWTYKYNRVLCIILYNLYMIFSKVVCGRL